ncbi:MAG: autotransporter domain-containing protein, partial [Gemmatimonadetes bacterium]|nr:autotransporter domain-containing protein [Gemmatimonadota bacterium]
DDAVVEAKETFTVGLSVSGTSETVRATDTATGTILDDDGGTTGNATVTIADASADEGDELTFTVTLDNAVTGGVSVTPSFTDGTATSGTDYTENTTSLTFVGTAGETQTFTVTTTDDAVVEDDETFTIGLSVSGTSETVRATDTATGTIRDDDDGHHVSLSASPAEVPEGASPTVVRVTATAVSASSSARTVVVAVGSHGDEATAMAVAADRYDDGGPTSRVMAVGNGATTGDTDYLAVDDFEVTIPANETSGTATFTLVPIDDLIVEGNEAISVTGDGVLMVVTGTTMTLVDNDRHEVSLSASPAEVAEGASPTLVTVRAAFSNGGSFPVDKTVVVRVGGGTAKFGTDYDATPEFAVTIAAGATSGTGTFTLAPADDDIVEGDETIEVSGASEGLVVRDALLTLADDDAVPERGAALEFGLAGIGRTIATQAVDAIGARFEAASRLSRAAAPDGRFQLDPFAVAGILQAAGVDLPRLDARVSVPGDLGTSRPGTTGGGAWSQAGVPGGRGLGSVGLLARAFGADGSGAGGWTLWTTGAGTNFSGHPGDFSVDGRMGAAYLGVDRSLGSNAVLGVAVARNQGGVNAEHDSNWMGDVDARLTTVYPYARWAPTPKLDLWGTLGLGRGDVEMDDGASSFRTDSRLRMGAMGLRGDLASVGAVDLAVRADAFTVGMTADEVAGTIKAADGRAQRARLMLDVSTGWALSSSSRLTPSIEMGARADGGDVETGPGMELGGGLAYGNSRLGLDITARGRWLAVHRDDRFGEWGANMSIRRMPSNPNRGLSISVEPAWNEDASGITALWEGRNLRRGDFGFGLRPENASEAWQPDRLDMQVSYGTDVLTPFGRMRMMGGGSRHLQVGTALELAGARDGGRLKLELLGEQRARAGGAADYGATLRLAGANLGSAGGVAAPFGEFTQESAGQRLKLGTQLQLAAGGKLRNVLPPFRLELVGEANRKANEGTTYGFFLRGSSTLGGW